MNRTPVAQRIRARVDKQNCIKFKFLQIKGNNYQNQETTHRVGEKPHQPFNG
jgi:hypothetical protein